MAVDLKLPFGIVRVVSSSVGTHVPGDSVRRIDYVLTSDRLQQVCGGWEVAHDLAVLPDPENYHLPLL
eukprot:6526846-Prorocentrum_lima.AAC.1